MSAVVEMADLSKWYGQVIGVNDITLSINSGVTGLLGPNGAGKSTLLKLMVGLLKPSRGSITVLGESVWNNPDLSRRIGYCPEQDAFYDDMTGFQFVVNLARLNGYSRREAEQRALRVIEIVDLLENKGRKIGAYSKGMRQRIKLAQSLVHDPELLFLDEPSSGLDPVGRREVLETILRLKGETTVFMSTHILSDVERVCDIVGIIDQGRLITESPMEQLREQFAHSVFELEFEEEADSFLDSLRPLSWVSKVEKEPGDDAAPLRVVVHDVTTAKRELPKIVAESGFTLLRYELTLPSLEDVFVELVGHRGNE